MAAKCTDGAVEADDAAEGARHAMPGDCDEQLKRWQKKREIVCEAQRQREAEFVVTADIVEKNPNQRRTALARPLKGASNPEAVWPVVRSDMAMRVLLSVAELRNRWQTNLFDSTDGNHN
jgi:hypothetical protein